jgi:hypothetical protein
MAELPEARIVRAGEARAAHGGAPSVPALRLAPRRVPRRLALQLLFGLDQTKFGWVFAALGMAFVCGVVPRAQWTDHEPQFAWWVVLLVLVFPVVGLWFATRGFASGRRSLRLLRLGVETTGKLLRKKPTRIEINDQPVMALTFEYFVDGDRFTTVVNVLDTQPLEDDAREPMICDPWDRSIATTLDHLPGSPRITGDGELACDPGFGVHLLLLPIATAALIVATIVQLIIY